ncbi:MAG TPA: hypothetical protein VFF78_07765 [Anaerolineaceae bacterium]|nr:hypothetical protein [Anaerolineaceae bacterium]
MDAIYWQGKNESQLAAFQQAQIGNTCAAHAIAAALNLACGLHLDGRELGRTAYANWWRLWGNPFHAGIPPYAQIALLKHLRKTYRLDLDIKHFSWDPQRWLEPLAQPDRLLLVTFYWLARPAFLARVCKNWKYPRITYGRASDNLTNTDGIIITGHTMLLAAYDPGHTTFSGEIRPWGFINSWMDGGNTLFWMGDKDLRFLRQVLQLIFPSS